MTDSAPDATSNPAQEQARSSEAAQSTPPFGAKEHAAADAPATDGFSEAQFALELGKEWIRQHQTAAMLGAFAIGAFVGALMRRD